MTPYHFMNKIYFYEQNNSILYKEVKTMNHETETRGCGTSKNCKEHIKGIRCDVKNCMYHDCETYCMAGEIAVGPSNARSSSDTVCVTFKERK